MGLRFAVGDIDPEAALGSESKKINRPFGPPSPLLTCAGRPSRVPYGIVSVRSLPAGRGGGHRASHGDTLQQARKAGKAWISGRRAGSDGAAAAAAWEGAPVQALPGVGLQIRVGQGGSAASPRPALELAHVRRQGALQASHSGAGLELGWAGTNGGSQSSGAGVTKTKTAPGRRPCRGLGPGQANTQTQRHRGYKTSLGLLLSRADQRPTWRGGPKATTGPCALQDWES